MQKREIVKKISAVLCTGALAVGVFTPFAARAEVGSYNIGQKFTEKSLEIGEKAYVIDYKYDDVTGDKIKDDILLVGQKLYSENDIFADNLNIVVKDGKTNEFAKITDEDLCGYEGNLFVGDFSGDKVKDVMVTADTGGSGGVEEHFIASFVNNAPKAIFTEEDNEGLRVKGKYIDGFKANLKIENEAKEFILDLSANKEEYIKQGIYDKAGKVLAEVEPISCSFGSLKAIDWNADGTLELMGSQRIIGTCNADTISTTESLWQFNNSKWNLKRLQYTTLLIK